MLYSESDQILINEMRRIDRALAQRQKVFDSLSAAQGKQIFNRRYVLDLPIDLDEMNTASAQGTFANPVVRSFVVDRDALHFCCKEMVYTVSAVGAVDGVSGRFSLLPSTALWFNYEVRDTYSDRGWQNLPLPDLALASGKTAGLALGCPAILPAGTEVSFTVYPLSALPDIDTFTAQSYSVQISFIGYEVL